MKIAANLTTGALIAAALAVSAAAPAAAQPKPENRCILTRDLRNHTIADDHTLYFDVGGRAIYRVEANGCFAGATSTDPIVLRDRASTGRICNKMDLDISVRGASCIVTSMTKLTPEEAAALPRRVHP
jgi:hypothetical protein